MQHAKIPVAEDDIQRNTHAERVDLVGRLQHQRLIALQGALPDQTSEPRRPRIRPEQRMCDDAPIGGKDELFWHVK